MGTHGADDTPLLHISSSAGSGWNLHSIQASSRLSLQARSPCQGCASKITIIHWGTCSSLSLHQPPSPCIFPYLYHYLLDLWFLPLFWASSLLQGQRLCLPLALPCHGLLTVLKGVFLNCSKSWRASSSLDCLTLFHLGLATAGKAARVPPCVAEWMVLKEKKRKKQRQEKKGKM